MVAEILEAHHHRGERPPLFFYRDRKGLEVDAVVELGRTLVAVEAKSGRTAASDFFASLRRFAKAVEQPTRCLVVYAGEQAQRRAGGTLLPCRQLDAFDWRRGRFLPGKAP